MTHRAQGGAVGRAGVAQRSWISLKRADFAAALAAPILSKSLHFVLHHTAAWPDSAVAQAGRRVVQELSTGNAPRGASSVDNNQPPSRWWLGLVVPKRHAKRAVTRTLLKRQMRAQAQGHHPWLPPGQWLVRLRAPFDARQYPSAASAALGEAARKELEQVFAEAAAAMSA